MPSAAPRSGLAVYAGSAIVVAGVAVFAFALIAFLRPGAEAPVRYWWLMMAGPGLAIVGVTVGTAWRAAGLVAASLLLGFAAQLAFKDPFWFQHYRLSLGSLFAYAMFATLGAQVVIAAVVLIRSVGLGRLLDAGSRLGWLRLAVLGAVLAVGSVSALDLIGGYKYRSLLNQSGISLAFLGVNILSFIALVIACPGEKARALGDRATGFVSLPGSGEQAGRFDRRLAWGLALGVFVFCVFARLVVFENIPRIDEVIYLVQANFFAQGRLSLPVPASPEAFYIYMMDTHAGLWFPTAAPGWPAVLAVGVFFGATWIVNPLFGAISVLLLHALVTKAEDRKLANLVLILLVVSPWFVWTSSTLMTHSLTLALVLGAWLMLLKARTNFSPWLPLAAGAMMGLDFLTRPLEALVIGALTGLWLLSFLKDRRHLRTVTLYSIGCIAIGAFVFPFNAHLTGDLFQTPMNAFLDRLWGSPGANRLGFGPDIGAKPRWGALDPFPGHSPYEALIQAQQMFYSLSSDLLGWAIGSVSFAMIFVLWGRRSKLTSAMIVITVATVAVQAIYWFGAFDYVGPRYWFMMLVPMLVLTAAGIVAAARKLEQEFPGALVGYRLGVSVAVLCLCSVVVFSSWLALNKYPGFRGYHADYRDLAAQPNFKRALVFITMEDPIEYENAIWLNDFNPASDRPLFARDLGDEINRRVAESYPGRPIYFVNGRPKDPTRGHVSVARGPLLPADLARKP